MKKDEQTEYPPFDPARFKAAVTKAIAFWQAKLNLTDWFILPPRPNLETNGFQVAHEAGYQNTRFYYGSLEKTDWASVSDEWCAHSVGHELLHLLFSPIGDLLILNLSGRWLRETDDAEEGIMDRLATLIWGFFSEEERAQITALFAAARKV